MQNHRLDQYALPSQLKHLVADLFRLDLADPEKIPDQAPLIGGELGLDSLDAMELAMSVEEEFGITISTGEDFREAFGSIASLADFIRSRTQPKPRHGRRSAAA